MASINLGRALALLAMVIGLGAAPAGADDSAPAAEPRWEIMVAPYAWGTAISGDARVRGVEADVDMSFKEILDRINIGFFGKVQVRRDRVFVFSDVVFANLSDEVSAGPVELSFGPATLTTTVPVGPRGRGTAVATVGIPRVSTLVGPAEVDIGFKMLTVDLAAGYRLFSAPISQLLGEAGADDPRRLDVDVFAGARYWRLEPEFTLKVPPVTVPGVSVNPRLALTGPGGRFTRDLDFGDVEVFSGLTTAGIDQDFEADEWWIDPLLGIRAGADVTERIRLMAMGDVGGFGIGSAADFSWQAAGLVSWRFAEQWSVVTGYRARGVDRDHGDLGLDLVLQGPVFGFIWRFQI